MASILDKYGIKEVADITFYELDKNGKPAYPVLYIDTAKTSTIEVTADEATANGGKGNPALISWDYNKDITVTLEDALFSAKSMAIMFGNGKVKTLGDSDYIMKTEIFTATKAITDLNVTNLVAAGWKEYFEGPDGKTYKKLNPKFFDAEGKSITSLAEANTKYFCSFDLKATGSVISVGHNTFPGTYYVTGDTYARSEASGEDEFFQFVISKAKVTSENTLTLEADGDPAVFDMNLHVLRPESGDMMKLIKYNLTDGTEGKETDLNLYHNHELNIPNADETTTATYTVADADKAREAGVKSADITATATTVAYIINVATTTSPTNEGVDVTEDSQG